MVHPVKAVYFYILCQPVNFSVRTKTAVGVGIDIESVRNLNYNNAML